LLGNRESTRNLVRLESKSEQFLMGDFNRFNQVLEGTSMPGTPSMYKNEMSSYYQPTAANG
jgi:hypothetical protein